MGNITNEERARRLQAKRDHDNLVSGMAALTLALMIIGALVTFLVKKPKIAIPLYAAIGFVVWLGFIRPKQLEERRREEQRVQMQLAEEKRIAEERAEEERKQAKLRAEEEEKLAAQRAEEERKRQEQAAYEVKKNRIRANDKNAAMTSQEVLDKWHGIVAEKNLSEWSDGRRELVRLLLESKLPREEQTQILFQAQKDWPVGK